MKRHASQPARVVGALKLLNDFGVHRLHCAEAINVLQSVARFISVSQISNQEVLGHLLDRFGHPEQRLAVYGTLAPGRSNFPKLADVKGSWHLGSVAGSLHESGWAVKHGFRGFHWQPKSGNRVSVHVLQSPMLVDRWASLDKFEGIDYVRIWVPVEISDMELICNIYALSATQT